MRSPRAVISIAMVVAILTAGCSHAGSTFIAKPDGTWTQVRTGSGAGRTWTLFVAPNLGGAGTCLGVATDPPYVGQFSLDRGKSSECLPEPGKWKYQRHLTAFDDEEVVDGINVFVGLVVPAVQAIGMVTGSTTTVVPAAGGYFVFVYPQGQDVTQLELLGRSNQVLLRCDFNSSGPFLQC